MSDTPQPFYVGYLPTPTQLKRFLWLSIGPMLLLAWLLSGWIANSQQTAGTGDWQPANRVELNGFLSLDPYPVLHLADGRSVLLVRPGKTSANELVQPYAGQQVAISGAPIERGGWTMLELYRAEDIGPQPATTGASAISPPTQQPGTDIKLQGEIVDSKCFLGVMKPGAGKVHRACAAMCLTGGMPPMLVVTDSQGLKYGYMLLAPDGGSASRLLVPDVAVPVSVSGRLEVRGDLTYLRLHPNGVQRLQATAPTI